VPLAWSTIAYINLRNADSDWPAVFVFWLVGEYKVRHSNSLRRIEHCTLFITALWCLWAASSVSAQEESGEAIIKRLQKALDSSTTATVDVAVHIELTLNDNLRKGTAEYEVAVERPKKVAIIGISKDYEGPSLVSDGQKQIYYNHAANTYMEDSSFESIDAIVTEWGTDILRPLARFVPGVNTPQLIPAEGQNHDLQYLGTMELDSRPYYHFQIRWDGDRDQWDLWLAHRPPHLPRRLLVRFRSDGSSGAIRHTYGNWVLDEPVPAAKFRFVLPENSRRIR
jgi:hypothetical protein